MDDRDGDSGLELGAQLDELLGGEIQRQGLIQRRNTGKIQRFTASEDEKTVSEVGKMMPTVVGKKGDFSSRGSSTPGC